MAQTQMQDQQFCPNGDPRENRTRNVNLPKGNDTQDWEALPNDTLDQYKVNYPEQAESLQTIFNRLQVLKTFVDSNANHPDEFYRVATQTVNGLRKTSVQSGMSAGTPEAAQFTTLLDFTVDVGGVEELKRFVQYCFEEYYVLAGATEAKSRKYRACCACLFDTLATIQNFADFHQGFCSACVNAGVISICLENVKRIDAENLDWEEGDEDSEPVIIIDNCLGILYNISQRFKNRDLFANSLETLLCLAKKKVREIAAHSLLTLAYLVNENTNHLLLAEETLLSFIITLLDEAWQSEERRSIGYSAKELAEGLSHLAVNDTNKKILGQKGATSVLISVIKTSSEDAEKVSAIKALWMLAFDDNNKKAIRQEDGAVGLLCHLQHSKDSQVQRAAAGALWEVEGKTARNVEGTESTGNHVMISYQWDSQEMLVEVKNRLQASGYRVWMDLEQMRGSTLEAMAKAVENSSVVLVCVSERYKESPNCRSEAEYAYQLRKDIIPLMMQRKYRGDGWLGMLVGTKLWFDFNSQQSIEPSVTKLIKELGGRGKDVDNTDEPSVTPVAPAVHSDDVDTEPSSPGVSSWTNEEVKQWFKEIGLEKICKEDISEINGETLIDLQQLRGECPEYFYKCLERDLNLTRMVDIFKFRKELSQLVGY
ncbi:uncharacterized protein [Porites lutea]|uniref:uncharacterized protein n=1 Tax=Porites lutea TaxID=51062 RepID=UPI003CC6D8E8